MVLSPYTSVSEPSRLSLGPNPTGVTTAPAPASDVSGCDHTRSSMSVKVVVCGRLAQGAARFLHQIRFDEPVDVAIQNAIDVTDLLFRPVILHELIRVEDVAADLA